MKKSWVFVAIIPALGLGIVSAFQTPTPLLWNQTESAPKGLYWLTKNEITINSWAVVSADASSTKWISANRYLASGWPMIKRVRGRAGDRVCRQGLEIFINNEVAASALDVDSMGQKLPDWQGCLTLNEDEIFLLNDHPRSLDGRYFGPTRQEDLDGSARLVWPSE